MTVRIELRLPDASLNAHAKGHWRSKAKATANARFAAHAVAASTIRRGHAAFGSCVLNLTFHLPDNRRRDAINLAQSMKPSIDGMVDAGVMRDDSWQCMSIGSIVCKIDRENPRVTIEVVEAP